MENTHQPSKENLPTLESHKDPFSLFGKISAIVIIVAVLLTVGYFLGKNYSGNNSKTLPNQAIETSSKIPSSTDSIQDPQVVSPTASLSTTPSKPADKTVSAGLASSNAFKQYLATIPSGWIENRETTEISDKLTITNNGYSIKIYQAPFGGGGCIYAGDPPSEMSQSFSDFVQISGSGATYRRSFNKTGNPAGIINYTICQKGTDGSFGSITSFGAISAKSPDVINTTTMAQLDSIISSITKK